MLRSMIYYVNALEDWLKRKNLDLFSRKRIQLPTPHFVVFYNGTEKRPEYEEMRLSEAFCHKTDEPGIEVRCRVYNINPDNNRSLKERSAVLEGYTYFVEKVRTYRKEEFEDGMEQGIAQGIERGVGQGSLQRLVNQLCCKLKKGKTPEKIADALEEPVENIQKICRIAERYAPEYPVEEVWHALME